MVPYSLQLRYQIPQTDLNMILIFLLAFIIYLAGTPHIQKPQRCPRAGNPRFPGWPMGSRPCHQCLWTSADTTEEPAKPHKAAHHGCVASASCKGGREEAACRMRAMGEDWGPWNALPHEAKGRNATPELWRNEPLLVMCLPCCFML